MARNQAVNRASGAIFRRSVVDNGLPVQEQTLHSCRVGVAMLETTGFRT